MVSYCWQPSTNKNAIYCCLANLLGSRGLTCSKSLTTLICESSFKLFEIDTQILRDALKKQVSKTEHKQSSVPLVYCWLCQTIKSLVIVLVTLLQRSFFMCGLKFIRLVSWCILIFSWENVFFFIPSMHS